MHCNCNLFIVGVLHYYCSYPMFEFVLVTLLAIVFYLKYKDPSED